MTPAATTPPATMTERTKAMRVFATFHGASYAPSYGAESIEVHPSIAAAERSLEERYRHGHNCRVTIAYADGHEASHYMPSVTEGDSMTLWIVPEFDPELYDLASAAEEAVGLIYPDRIVTIGPRGGIRTTIA